MHEHVYCALLNVTKFLEQTNVIKMGVWFVTKIAIYKFCMYGVYCCVLLNVAKFLQKTKSMKIVIC